MTINPPALEKIQITSSPVSSQTCPGTKGTLVFNIATDTTLTAPQVQGVSAKLTGATTGSSTACSVSGSGTVLTADCSNLAAEAFTLDVEIPNGQVLSEQGCHRIPQQILPYETDDNQNRIQREGNLQVDFTNTQYMPSCAE